MQILQIGNGGGLNPTETNSSFLIYFESDDKFLLFDIGFNVMNKLIEIDEDDDNIFTFKKLKYVFVSHTHDDHIGNLETLIFYQSFKNNIIINVIGDESINEYLKLKNINNIYNGFEVEYHKHFQYYDEYNISGSFINDVELIFTPTNHGVIQCSGILLINKTNDCTIFISGDTKSTYKIEKILNANNVDLNSDKTILFHDFSLWDAPSKNVHACNSDFTIEYSEIFQNKCIKYHNNANFNDDWIKLNG